MTIKSDIGTVFTSVQTQVMLTSFGLVPLYQERNVMAAPHVMMANFNQTSMDSYVTLCRAIYIRIESCPFPPHSICPFFGETRAVFEAYFPVRQQTRGF